MPFKSKAQMRKFFAMEARGELPKGTAKRWLEHTKNVSKLPERKRSKKGSYVTDKDINRLIDAMLRYIQSAG
jgi:glutamate-1-semialdehyde aminotransferase